MNVITTVTNVIYLTMEWLHLLATAVWIGAMVVLLLVIIPSGREVLEGSEFKKLMKSAGKRMTFLVNISIIVLVVTGIGLGIEKDTGWSSTLLVKHVMVFAMIAIHLGRNKIIGPKLEQMAAQKSSSKSFVQLQKLQMNLVWVNLALGILVLLLSAVLAAL